MKIDDDFFDYLYDNFPCVKPPGFSYCNECRNMLLCGDQGTCMAIVEQERRKNRLAMDKLHPGERFALMFGKKTTKQPESNDPTT